MLKIYATPGQDPGLLFQRSLEETESDVPRVITTLWGPVSVGSVSISVNATDEAFTNSVITMTQQDGSSDRYTVSTSVISVEKQVLTLTSPLRVSYAQGADVCVYTTPNASIAYSEDEDVFQFVMVTSLNADAKHPRILTGIHAGHLSLDNGVMASFTDVEVSLGATSLVPANIPMTGTRGSYQVIVCGANEDMACATFFISKSSSSTDDASVFTMTSSASSWGETLGLRWSENKCVQLYHHTPRVLGDASEIILYKIKYMGNK